MKPIYPLAQIEMLLELLTARLASEVLSIEQILRLVSQIAQRVSDKRLSGTPGAHDPSVRRLDRAEAAEEIAELLVHRASKLVPGAKCLHRALACRLWLARRGVPAQVVVGFRKRGAIEGHAWLEIETPDGPRTLFKTDEDGYRESFREAAA